MAAVDEEYGGGFPWRLRRVEKAVDAILSWRTEVDTTMAQRGEQYKNMEQKIDNLATAVDSLRKVIMAFALSVAGSAIVFALTVLIATGKIGG